MRARRRARELLCPALFPTFCNARVEPSIGSMVFMSDTPKCTGAPAAGDDPKQPSRSVESRLLRPGEAAPSDNDWSSSTPSERIAGVWELTQQCLAWNREGGEEPRLQRDVTRVIRKGR